MTILAWVLFGYALLYGVRYLLGARVYLTCALREVEVRPIPRERLDPAELRLLTLLDDELAAAGFRHLGFGQIPPFLTYYAQAVAVSVFVNERIPAYALVRQHAAPEYGNLVEVEVATAFGAPEDGRPENVQAAPGGATQRQPANTSDLRLVTLNTLFSRPFQPRSLRVEGYEGMPVAALVERHAARVAAERNRAPMEPSAAAVAAEHSYPETSTQQPSALPHSTLESALNLAAASIAELRTEFRGRGWVAPTTDPTLDRFTLRGAFALTHYSRRVFGSRKITSRQQQQQPTPSEQERLLRIEADLHAISRVADNPESAPGTPWPLVTVIGVSGLLSFVAMAWLWNPYVAALILAAITLHEAGHAVAMRMLGYRDVHVFFVPLLGAMTVGRSVTTTVRDRLAVLLAGPVPGLCLAVVLLAIDQAYAPATLLRMSALALLILNGLNLLPFTPLDGGRALETLTRPESVWRLVVHAASAVGLLAVAAYLRDPVIATIGLFWAVLFPRQLQGYRLRRSVAAAVNDRGDFQVVLRVALETMSTPRYATWRAGTRQVTARTLARLFSESLATPADRRWGAIAYAAAWIPAAIAMILWTR
jgi:Zn-dependent protease